MTLKSSFNSDLKKEQRLTLLLDTYYHKNLNHYYFKRVSEIKLQLAGIDVIFVHKTTGESFNIDEKAQLDYINEDLPTFAFEINYHKKGRLKKGWLFDLDKQTQFYALITGIYEDEPTVFTSCKITLVNREKLLDFLSKRKIQPKTLNKYIDGNKELNGKCPIKELNQRSEGYLYLSRKNKAEKPVNLVLKLDFLIENDIAKRLA
ncbi:hypothetical protein ACOCEA_04710 [Maribacter sp. CXY002]|uniref:hypothetical protein n=1 Tax=Maribacter luteocoastalis TaxID=3407671 RepID=UPI003B679B9A